MEKELDLQEILKKAEAQTDFPDVPLDEFTPPTYEEWKENCIALLKGAPFDKKMYTKTYEGITFDPMYFRNTTEEILPRASFPGMDDFLRGSSPTGYIKTPWGIAQACDETLPEDTNELLKHETAKGSTIYNVVLDDATKAGVDARKAKEPGKGGVSLTTLDDVHTLLDGLDFEKYPLYIYAGRTALPMLAQVAAVLKASGKGTKNLRGFIAADPIGELAASGTSQEPLATLYDEMAAAAKWALKHAPGLRTVLARSDVYSRGGANDVQETAYTISTAVTYLRELMARGLSIDEAASQIMFQFSMGANFFMQIAKLRAIRPIWAQIVEAFGGIESYENEPFDEPIRKGDEFSRRIARNVQIILQEEFGMLSPIDPAGGSWAVERLTKQIKEKIWAEFQEVEKAGGIVADLQSKRPQQAIADILAQRFKNSELRRDRIVGNNMYPNMTEKPLDPRPENMDDNRTARTAVIEGYLKDIDDVHKDALLGALADAAKDDSLVTAAIAAAEAGATLPELMTALAKGATGEATTVDAIAPHRWSERFEALRKRTENYVKAHDGDNVRIFLANMGPIPQHKARADFTRGFLQVGAFDVLMNDGFKTVEDAAAAAKESGADACVICSTDATYPDIVPALAPKLHEALPSATVYLAGAAPKDLLETYKAAGIDDYISVRANCYEILEALQKKKGMMD